MADNGGCASTPTAKRKKQGARCSDRQLYMLIDYIFSNRVLVRAATESTLTTAERTALWDVITGRLNAEGPAWKERVEWKNLWNARVCAARKHDGLLAVEAARTGGGANPVGPLNEVETRILAIVGRDSSRGCGGLRPRQSLLSSSEASVTNTLFIRGVAVITANLLCGLHCQQSFSTKRRAWGRLQRCRFSRPASQLLQEVDSRLLIVVNRN
ncbi:hypothetical protein HPB47_017028 [Ixodes persulcatus]|uniref:Uncharacterized protein n=1 Tax=Ixodes persulcatus TaxID=34615 RepID=A0AC60QPG5_IXOPE|nr:hypothetical protein HPB47_017028 [Ixodes persulcatus]